MIPPAPCLLLALLVSSTYSIPTVRVKENANATLQCNKGESDLWILPDNQIVTANQTSTIRDISIVDGVLFFPKVAVEDDGTYSCTYRNDSVLLLHQMRVEVEPKLEDGDAWGKYQSHFVTGFIAAGTVAGIILFGCLVFKFRYKTVKEFSADRSGLMPPSDVEGTMADHRF